tara:strand:+ start:1279 stop:2409 length:1131 start_codon:yes stop_codon:yes gene_type:complete
MKILAISNKVNHSESLQLFGQEDITFLYWSGRLGIFGSNYPYNNGVRLHNFTKMSFIRRIIIKQNIDIIYFFTDVGFPVYKKFAKRIFKTNFGIPKVFAMHNHLLKKTDYEKAVIKNADGYVFLNKESFEFYNQAFSLTNPVTFIPSLYLPKFSTYKTFIGQEKLSNKDKEIHVAMGGRFITSNPNVDIKNYYNQERYDFINLCIELAKRKVHCHIFGDYVFIPNGRKPVVSSAVKSHYEYLIKNYNYIHYEGVPSNFEYVLSRYDFFICKGFLPNYNVDFYEHINYQARFNSALIASLPLIIATGTDKTLEEQVNENGGGIVFEDFDILQKELVKVLKDKNLISMEKIKKINSFDAWVDQLKLFFSKVIERHNRD